MMRMKNKTMLMTALCGVACACLIGGGTTLAVTGVAESNSSTTTDVTETKTYTVTAAVKWEIANAIRYCVEMDATTYGNLSENAKAGLLIIPSDMLTGELAIGTENAADVLTYGTPEGEGEAPETWKQNAAGNYYKYVRLENVPYLSYNRELTAVAYTVDGTTSYSNVKKCSIADIALIHMQTSTNVNEIAALEGYLNDYTVQFDYADEVTDVYSASVEYGSELTVPNTHPVRTGYKFLGWYERTDTNGDTPTYADVATDFNAANAKLVKCGRQFIAKWEALDEKTVFSPAEYGIAGATFESSPSAQVNVAWKSATAQENYSGEYYSLTPIADSSATIKFQDEAKTNAVNRLADWKAKGYDAVKVWVKAVPTNDATTSYTFNWCAGCPTTSLTVKTNVWTQAVLPMAVFEKCCTTTEATWLLNVALGANSALSEFCFGDVTVADVLADNVIYSPFEKRASGMDRAGSSGTSTLTYVDVDEAREGYQGAYLSYVQNGTSGANTLDLLKDDNIKTRITALKAAGNTYVKAWVKATTKDSAVNEYTFTWCAGAGAPNVTVKTNEWVQVALPMSVFEGYYDLEMTSSGKAWLLNVSLGTSGTLSEFCIGDITAEALADNVLYTPVEKNVAGLQLTSASGGACTATYHAGDLKNTSYQGTYVEIASSNGTAGLTTFYYKQTDDLTSRLTKFVETGKTTVKIWMKVESTAETVTLTWFAGPSGNSLTATVKTNEWTQVELPITNFKAEYEYTSGHWSSCFTWSQMTKVCLGEVTVA